MSNTREEPTVFQMETRRNRVWLVVLAGLVIGSIAWFGNLVGLAEGVWLATTVIVLLVSGRHVVWDAMHGRFGVDVIAILAMATAILLHEYLASAVIALMLSGGEALEDYASGRAKRALTELVQRAPREAHRYVDGRLEACGVKQVEIGDVLLVKPGEVVPVDGVLDETAVLDESALTGEALPVERPIGGTVLSGVVNAGGPFRFRATATAAESAYEGIVRLVEQAQADKAPFVRLADRYAGIFLPLTLAIAGAAWLWSGDPQRALAVLVVATPCPLILAAPIAIIAGVSRAARRGVIVKGGGALESMAHARTLVFDKTGTLTTGRSSLSSIESPTIDPDELLRIAASLDQLSPHVFATAIIAAARSKGLSLSMPQDAIEEPGSGISGVVDGHRVSLGRSGWVARGQPLPDWARRIRRRVALEGTAAVLVAIDGHLVGALILEDPIRPDASGAIRDLRRAGIERIVMLTGDHEDVAQIVGSALGVDRVLAERSPADKVDAVRAEHEEAVVVMVGDGINDAPALAVADVGVAVGARGATAASEAADAVLMVDRLDRIADAMRIGRRSRHIALQSVIAGMALSFVAMGFATAGVLTPVVGAFLQEAIDVAVIINALRALRQPGLEAVPAVAAAAGLRFRAEHRELLPKVDDLRRVADKLDRMEPRVARAELVRLKDFVLTQLLPHEETEGEAVFPYLGQFGDGEDPTSALLRTHVEIVHQTRLLERLVDELPESGPNPDDLVDLRRILYGLHAVLRLHFAQEEEAYVELGRDDPAASLFV